MKSLPRYIQLSFFILILQSSFSLLQAEEINLSINEEQADEAIKNFVLLHNEWSSTLEGKPEIRSLLFNFLVNYQAFYSRLEIEESAEQPNSDRIRLLKKSKESLIKNVLNQGPEIAPYLLKELITTYQLFAETKRDTKELSFEANIVISAAVRARFEALRSCLMQIGEPALKPIADLSSRAINKNLEVFSDELKKLSKEIESEMAKKSTNTKSK
ncbi:MAG: hypothetical protein JWQ35_298 [Bacteriovoracaceae bacterium]|nr:hypothetical protein [Bacteriovoracaceae bacterium]